VAILFLSTKNAATCLTLCLWAERLRMGANMSFVNPGSKPERRSGSL
jgi:hypothetical protein